MLAFSRLGTERLTDSGPIPYSACVGYARRAGMDYYLVEHFVQVMQAMDAAYRGWIEDNRRPPRPEATEKGHS